MFRDGFRHGVTVLCTSLGTMKKRMNSIQKCLKDRQNRQQRPKKCATQNEKGLKHSLGDGWHGYVDGSHTIYLRFLSQWNRLSAESLDCCIWRTEDEEVVEGGGSSIMFWGSGGGGEAVTHQVHCNVAKGMTGARQVANKRKRCWHFLVTYNLLVSIQTHGNMPPTHAHITTLYQQPLK